jgi:2,3-bisphosphoglycerate-dependent phosphoglycerate mutase
MVGRISVLFEAAVLVLVKHALPVLDMSRPPREWPLSAEGELQSKQLAGRLREFLPLRLVTSTEPKAWSTGRVIAAELDLQVSAVDGVQEFDRPASPWQAKFDRERENAAIFDDPTRRVLGEESGLDALNRFSAAIRAEQDRTVEQNLVVVTHGTVIALFVAAHNPVNAFELWRDLECCSFVVLDRGSFSLREIVRSGG